MTWFSARSAEAPRLGYAASEFRTQQWLSEAPIERWFPLYAREHFRFDAHGTVRLTSLNGVATEQPRVLPRLLPQGHVPERLATGDHASSCHPDAECQIDELRRSGTVRVDIHTHRKSSKRARVTSLSSGGKFVYKTLYAIFRPNDPLPWTVRPQTVTLLGRTSVPRTSEASQTSVCRALAWQRVSGLASLPDVSGDVSPVRSRLHDWFRPGDPPARVIRT
jgi:hypothetical protein